MRRERFRDSSPRRAGAILTLFAVNAACAGDAAKIEADVIYGRKDGMALTLDVLKPAKPNGAGVLWIQSGGWYSNWTDPKLMFAISKGLFLDKGTTVFVVRHGSAPKYAIPDAVADVRRSVRFIRSRAKSFGVDPERLGAFGGERRGPSRLGPCHHQ